ncbi:putative thiamine transporter SLC35F3 isoform X1 [Macrosteles quadrilineatus]|uniref:putative thiamine transporter SLC35F3 isoform X1 n=1 Tax=Macrosteles quadrilineatus TaxID=74068 RepID=UPI0023E199E6|nr:putative thiamine transporter SLC35F3 isoform X1 [Macrosteles quadrilineatus]XP_054266378.1 putative thiamine transporter SLC35F3 isoform X1 [Macrosteles quadrilineatus]XP_054266380.1 putative thiamine transporter SLC35F3 isoform X1 [Macrosteles quadrilineatus]XP_054266381.1 putative thiamine transporter SLC35F3 isoform X1 [Macrosteles quadrilineatus]XP_054266382.1 putative thiamine transporter SLC35F3 isoform X1 [Macrosteles quadrilineatus]XP_054266733.1 putative thiamine transporter SLC35
MGETTRGEGGDIPTIFNPHRVRAPPNLVVTNEAPRGSVPNGPYGRTSHTTLHSDTESQSEQPQPVNNRGLCSQLRSCKNSCCSKSAKKIYYGVCVTVCVTASWVGATHAIKYLYFQRSYPISANSSSIHQQPMMIYDAPFFTTWFCTNWTVLFFPLYMLCHLATNRCKGGDVLAESVRNFREKGFTAGRFLTRCSFFCLLWVATNYMYIRSLRILLATDVMALFATNVSCVYLLSWVILHEQFVGVRIVAVILCDTGVALLAYMDGITGSPTLSGVVLAASAAACSAVYKVLFKKVIGDASYGQVSLFFSIIGLLNASLLWPLCLTLYFTGMETLYWDRLPWPALLAASILSLVANLLGNFSVAVTYDLFITLGLITAVPVSAALDVVLYGAHFYGMKLAGMVLISIGFFLVMFPENWPDYITRLLRNIILLSHSARWSRRHRHGAQANQQRPVIDYRTGYIRSHLRSPSGRVR